MGWHIILTHPGYWFNQKAYHVLNSITWIAVSFPFFFNLSQLPTTSLNSSNNYRSLLPLSGVSCMDQIMLVLCQKPGFQRGHLDIGLFYSFSWSFPWLPSTSNYWVILHWSTLLSGASVGLLKSPNHLRQDSVTFFSIGAAPTFSLIHPFPILSFLVCPLIHHNILISTAFSLCFCWHFISQHLVL